MDLDFRNGLQMTHLRPGKGHFLVGRWRKGLLVCIFVVFAFLLSSQHQNCYFEDFLSFHSLRRVAFIANCAPEVKLVSWDKFHIFQTNKCPCWILVRPYSRKEARYGKLRRYVRKFLRNGGCAAHDDT